MRTTTAWPPEVEAVLRLARRLTPAQIHDLALAYQDAAFDEPARRRRMVDLAVRRAQAEGEWRELQAAVAHAVHEAAGPRHAALSRLALLFDAELAVADAVAVLLLAERFSAEVARHVGGPWRSVACS